MPLDLGETIAATFVANMLIQGTKESIKGIWNYSKNLVELQGALKEKLHELEETLIRINKMNPIQSRNLFTSELLEEIEEFWYKMYDLKDEPNSHLEYLTGSLSRFVTKIAEMQKELKRRETTMERELAEKQGQPSGSQSARHQKLWTHQKLWVDDKIAIIQNLKGASSLGVTIVGICGSGKTLLARAVAEDGSITEHFHIIPAPTPPPPLKFSYDCVTKHIKKNLPANKSIPVLFLLDGLQEVDPTDWVFFCRFCKEELHPESKVLVTTQNPQIADATGTDKYLIRKLSDDECFTMILDVASTAGKLDDADQNAITAFKDALVKKCMGLPLLAHRIGALLSTAGKGKCETSIKEDIIPRDLWKWEEFGSVLGNMTLVSLLQEKPFLKWCLNYCSLFPPDTEFSKDLLLQLWMAEELIPFSKEEEHFKYLLSHSIFQSSDNNPPYAMHQLAYDFAQNVKYGAFYRQDIGESSISPSTGITDITRHFSLSCKDSTGNGQKDAAEGVLDVIERNCKKLRTFLLVQPAGRLITENPTFFQSLTRLRVLDLSHTTLKELSPKTISKLRCLCYLDLSSTPIKAVPSLSKNRKLQVLKLNGCKNLRNIQIDITKLTNLLYFQANIANHFPEMPPWMGQLKNLRGLEVFIVGDAKSGQGIEQLKEMNDLREPLKIARLENVRSGSEAREADLQKKLKLETLTLEWSADSAHAEAREVLEGLKPPQTLTELRIINYSGSEFPEWLSKCRGLNTIKLDDCKGCSKLPPLVDLPLLKHIHLRGMTELTELPVLPSSLKSLTIEDCSNVLEQHCLDPGADWRNIKDLVVTIDPSGSTQIGDPQAVNDSDSRTLHEERRRAHSPMPMDASGSVGQQLDSSNDEHDSNGQNFESGRQHPLMETDRSQNKGKQKVEEGTPTITNQQKVDEGTSSSQSSFTSRSYSGNETEGSRGGGSWMARDEQRKKELEEAREEVKRANKKAAQAMTTATQAITENARLMERITQLEKAKMESGVSAIRCTSFKFSTPLAAVTSIVFFVILLTCTKCWFGW